VPDIISFALRLDLGNRWTDPVNHNWKVNTIGVMHYWITSELSAEHRLDREFAAESLLGAVNAFTGPPFPVPGDHCTSCPTRACRPDDLVRGLRRLHRSRQVRLRNLEADRGEGQHGCDPIPRFKAFLCIPTDRKRRNCRVRPRPDGDSSIKVTFDAYGHLFPGRGKEASGRYEKSMQEARTKSEADVSNVLAIEGKKLPKVTVTD
jgi:hypothetical protein